jgi:hypothetical protein
MISIRNGGLGGLRIYIIYCCNLIDCETLKNIYTNNYTNRFFWCLGGLWRMIASGIGTRSLAATVRSYALSLCGVVSRGHDTRAEVYAFRRRRSRREPTAGALRPILRAHGYGEAHLLTSPLTTTCVGYDVQAKLEESSPRSARLSHAEIE